MKTQFASVAVIGAFFATYIVREPDGVPLTLKVVSAGAVFVNKACGMTEGGGTSFLGGHWRTCWERFRPTTGTGSYGGVASTDVDVPFSGDSSAIIASSFKARIYVPDVPEQGDPTKLLPILVYFHGGGWTVGHYNDTDYDMTMRQLASQGNWIVVSPEYPLAPESPFPAGVRACMDTVNWVALSNNALLKRADTARQLFVGGDSAGGNLAAVVSILVRDGLDADLNPVLTDTTSKVSIAHQLLVYPKLFPSIPTASTKRFKEAYFIPSSTNDFFTHAYLTAPARVKTPDATSDSERRATLEQSDFRISPFLAPDGLQGLPSATMITAGLDPLLDEGRDYADQLRSAKVAVDHINFETMPHGFWQVSGVGLQEQELAISSAVVAVNTALGART
jgi:acetyl esterase